jgi:hypothetical protein
MQQHQHAQQAVDALTAHLLRSDRQLGSRQWNGLCCVCVAPKPGRHEETPTHALASTAGRPPLPAVHPYTVQC